MYLYLRHVLQGYLRYNIFNPLNVFNLSRVEHGKGAMSCPVLHHKSKRIEKSRRKGRPDTETSSDSDEERAAEAEARRSRDKERKRRLSEVEADCERVDRMIADAEAKNQAKMAKLAEVRKSYPVI